MAHSLHADDIVATLDESELGVVERTGSDVDTHIPEPQRAEKERIRRHRGVDQRAFQRFLRDGIPPKDTVAVRWQSDLRLWLVPTANLKLLDREFLMGDVVRKDAKDAMSGVVINTSTLCTLQPVHDVVYKQSHVLKGLVPAKSASNGFSRPDTIPPPLIDIPSCELQEPFFPCQDDLVVYRDWIGRVAAVARNVTVKLANKSVVEVSDSVGTKADGVFEEFAIGDILMAKKGDLRTGRWIYGAYDPNTPPVGTVVAVRPVAVEVDWLQQRFGCNSEEPPMELGREELESSSFAVYDRTRLPARYSPQANVAEAETTVSHFEMHASLGMRVRFKDLAGACVKYDGSTRHGKLTRLDRSATMGYDLNVFDITRIRTNVTVQWQDLSMTTEHSIDLVPDQAIDDEYAVWPGEIAHSLDQQPVTGIPGVTQPSRVGVVQSVNAPERMARIRWAPDATIQYSTGLDGEAGVKALLTGVVGVASGEIEELSLYDMEAPAALNVRRGDMVLIAHKRWTAEPDAQQPRGVDWIGEIIDTPLDGTLRVRLGAAEIVQDVILRREDVVVAIRSDDDWGGTFDEDAEFDGMDSDDVDSLQRYIWGDLEVAPHDDDEDFVDADSDLAEEPIARYEDENGRPMDEEEVEDDEWESAQEDEDGDVPMTDAQEQATPLTSTSATPPADTAKSDPNHVETFTASNQPSNEPPQYLVLDDAVPNSHHFSSTPPTPSNATYLKRLQKDHRILSTSLPPGIYIRTWSSRLDLLRVLFIGPSDTPYAHAPFLLDIHLPSTYPSTPPEVYFHSWTDTSLGSAGVGRVNPNLYEDGKICLSLLGTWESGEKGEGWNAGEITVLQVLVSILGLVLVKEPYFNEAGYESLKGLESSRRPSALYNERVCLRSLGFVVCCVQRLKDQGNCLEGFEDVVRWIYMDEEKGQGLLRKVLSEAQNVLETSEESEERGGEVDGMAILSRGACVPLRRVLERLRTLLPT